MTLKQRSPRMVGIVMCLVLGVLMLGAVGLTVIPWGVETYHAQFARSGGLKSGDEVRISGVGVGTVKSVKLDGTHVDVTFTVDDQVRLGKDTRAEVRLATLLGNKYLQVAPEGIQTLSANTIPLDHTHVTFDVQEVIEAGGTSIGKLDGKTLRNALQVTADAYRDTPEAIRLTLDGVGAISRELATRRDQLEALVSGASQVVATLQARSGDITDLMSQSDLLFQELLARRQTLHQLIVGTRNMAHQLSGLVADNAAVMKPLLARLRTVTTMLNARANDIDKALRAIGPTARYAANFVGNGPFGDARLPYPAPDNALCKSGVIKGCH